MDAIGQEDLLVRRDDAVEADQAEADDLLAEDFSATLIPAGKARTSVLFQAPNFSLIYTKLS